MIRVRELGFNVIRLVIPWEGVEHGGRGVYDQDYLDYLEEVVAAAERQGLYVLLNFHENLFSRFLYTDFNRTPELGEPGSIEYMLGALLPDSETLSFDGRITGDGAPRWAVEACLPHKDLDSPYWGTSHLLGNLGYLDSILAVADAVDLLLGAFGGGGDEEGDDGGGDGGPSLEDFLLGLLQKMMDADPPMLPFDVTETCDVFPFTSWWDNTLFSYDIGRCYGAFFAGDSMMPAMGPFTSGGKTWDMGIQDYLQGGYAGAWAAVAKQVGHHRNIVGYDLLNEPPGGFLMVALLAIYFEADFDLGAVEGFLTGLAGPETGLVVYELLQLLNVLPLLPPRDKLDAWMTKHGAGFDSWLEEQPPELCADAEDAETCRKEAFAKGRIKANYGYEDLDFFGILDLNLSFVVHLVNLYDRVSLAIRAEDPDAIIWIEPGSGALDSLIGGTFGDVSLWKPESIDQLVFTPHWYPDIYPFLGFNEPPREFTVEEWADQDWTVDLGAPLPGVLSNFGEIPVVYGEFGTYFNYNGIEESIASDYRISAEILDNYYEAYEALGLGRMLWCLSADNTYDEGDLWNYEDFSILGPDRQPRGELAWNRPYGRALAGRPISQRFWSDYHDYDPVKGVPDPWREFVLRYEGKETDAPTEIYVPAVQYPDGFYVWLSDGRAAYDPATQTLYHLPSNDSPGWQHEVILRPPQEGAPRSGWDYFFRGDRVLVGDRS
ncbi:MAG: cellulase family glycosylhydrolase [Deltaproteobacteria bacterium]|nr:cellulase family glycosylhydrolase [Deltaproteobacteria bacterium]